MCNYVGLYWLIVIVCSVYNRTINIVIRFHRRMMIWEFGCQREILWYFSDDYRIEIYPRDGKKIFYGQVFMDDIKSVLDSGGVYGIWTFRNRLHYHRYGCVHYVERITLLYIITISIYSFFSSIRTKIGSEYKNFGLKPLITGLSYGIRTLRVRTWLEPIHFTCLNNPVVMVPLFWDIIDCEGGCRTLASLLL